MQFDARQFVQSRYAVCEHCTKLTGVSLPPCLREIQAEAFIGRRALCSIVLPDKLRYIAHRAFGECGQLSCLHYRRLVRTTWTRPYAAHNAFESRYRLAIPWWLHYLPPNGSDCTFFAGGFAFCAHACSYMSNVCDMREGMRQHSIGVVRGY